MAIEKLKISCKTQK